MPLEVISYHTSYFSQWLDLVALSQLEVPESFLIWNELPDFSAEAQFKLLKKQDELLAYAILEPGDHENTITHFCSRKKALEGDFQWFLKEAFISYEKVKMGVFNQHTEKSLYVFPTKLIEERVFFFIDGKVDAKGVVPGKVVDHFYGNCLVENYEAISKQISVVNKDFMKPRNRKYLEIDLI